MTTLLQDLRFAIRSLLRHPVFAAVGVITLALGIGLNTAVFSAVDAMLLRSLQGVRAPEELAQIYRTWPGGEQYGSNSPLHFFDVRERSKDVFTDAAAWAFIPINLSFGGQNQRVFGTVVSANYFSVLGVVMERGRPFVSEEDVGPLAHPVAVISHSTWERTFGSDPQIVGRTVILSGTAYNVVGVTPPEFRGVSPIISPAIYVPLMQLAQLNPSNVDQLKNRGSNSLNVIARLKPGVTPQLASDRMKAIIRQLNDVYPDSYRGTGALLVMQSDAGIHPMFRQTQVQMSSLVMAVVVMLLLIACVNVANLFLARASERSREMAIRLSMGAERRRLIRQLLTESILFSVVSGIVGLLIASWAISLTNSIRIPIDVDLQPDLRLSVPVLLFTFAVSLVVGIVFGLAPALQATRPQLVPALKGEAPAGGSRSRLSAPLVVAQLALSMMLLICAGLFLRNLRSATAIDKGFNSDNVLVAAIDPSLQGYSRARSEQFYARLLDRLRAQPGVRDVALGNLLPLGLSNNTNGVSVSGYVASPDEDMNINATEVSPRYFETMQIPITRGRTFTPRDDSSAAKVMVVNERFVERFFKGRDAIGGTVRLGGVDRTIVGITVTGKYRSLGETPLSYIYTPQAQQWTADMNLVIRTTGDPAALIPSLRAEVAALDPDLPLADVKSLQTHLGIALLPSRIAGTALGVFGLLGLVLAAVGVYGVMSYSVAQRTREIGIRMAIGSSRSAVVGLIIRQGLRLVALGTVVGLLGAAGAAGLVRGLLYGERPIDPVSFVGVPLLLVGVAVLAIWIPARRAATVNPIVALRAE